VEYHTTWIHRALRITFEAARQAIPNWRSLNAVIVPEIERNLKWLARPADVVPEYPVIGLAVRKSRFAGDLGTQDKVTQSVRMSGEQ
jgi:hypothetical protein